MQLFEYEQSGDTYLLTKKYISELDLYLIVEAKVDNFTQSVKETLYFNIIMSLLITLLITLIILFYVRGIHKKLNALASNDALTGLPNRRTFYVQLEHYLLLKTRHSQSLSMIFIDVDDFKGVNDTYGHDVGDKVLKKITEVLKSTLRETDYIARWGGEEFAILLVETQLEDARLIAEQLRGHIEKSTLLVKQTNINVTISLGVAQANDEDNVDTLFKRVDTTLYQAKSKGKNQVAVSEN